MQGYIYDIQRVSYHSVHMRNRIPLNANIVNGEEDVERYYCLLINGRPLQLFDRFIWLFSFDVHGYFRIEESESEENACYVH